MGVTEITGPVSQSVNWLWNSVATSLPNIIAALIVILIGWLVAIIFEKIIRKALKQLKFDKWAKEKGFQKALFGISLENVIAEVVKWYLILLFIKQAMDVISMDALSVFFGGIISWIPTALLGVLTLVIALLIAHWARESISKARMGFSEIIGSVVYFMIVYFGVVLALPKFGLETTILVKAFELIVGGAAVGIAIALGLGFGLALKEPAKKFLKKWLE
ncbi:MAG: hypothetical protein PHW96_02640 [Candidatus Nanoarchaeia archaeon]|nr:hypothetical protein [Candidatus Nanoarchaeia archaeon]